MRIDDEPAEVGPAGAPTRDLETHFGTFFRQVAEEGLTPGACARILALVGQIVPFDLGTVWVRHGDAFSVAASIGRPIDLLEGMPFSFGLGLAAWIAETGRSVRIPSASRGFRGETLKGFLGVPVCADGEAHAVVALGRLGRAFSEEHASTLDQVAVLIGPAVRHGRICSRLRALAVIDPLTEAFTSGFFIRQVEVEVERAAMVGGAFGLLLFDVVRDDGRPPGPGTMLRIVNALRAGARSTDVLGRLDAGVVAVLMPGLQGPAIRQVGYRLLETVREALPGAAEGLTVSLRSAAFPTDGTTATSLLEACRRSSRVECPAM